MKADKLLEIIGEAKESYVLSALDSRNGKKATAKSVSYSRMLLVAAIITMTLLLVGCTIVYVISLQEKKISEASGMKYFDEEGQRIPPTEIRQDVISLFGYSNAPAQQAAMEWYQFRQTYDPDRKLFPYGDTEWDFDEQYFDSYGCYTQEMVDKLNEIVNKYDLKLLGISSTIQNWDTEVFFDATGLKGLCHEASPAEITYRSGHLFSDCAFDMGMTILLTGEDALWPHRVDATVYYTGKAYFRPLSIAIVPDAYDEWIYTVSDGTEILIAENNTGALLFAELENAYITVTITTNNNLIATGDDPKPSKQAIEQLAELFDFSIHPQVTDMDAVRTKLDESWEAWKTEEDERNKPVYFKGDFAEYLKKTYTKMSPSVFYTFYDINADGVEDLLLGDKDGTFSSAKAFYDGNVVDLHLSGPFHLCEDGVVEGHSSNGTYSSYGYYKLEGFDAQGRGSHVKLLEFLSYDSQENIYRYSDDGTDMPTVEVSEETAMAILEKHVHINLDMKPLMEFPIDEAGTTLEEYICANEVHITDKEQMAIYAEELQKAINSDTVEYNYYCLWDINGDGMEDLLLAEKDSFFTDAITIHNGEPYILWHWTHFNICENGVIKITSRNNQADRYHFFAYQDGERYLVDYLEYIATEDQWNRSSDGDYEIDQTITAEQANGILGSYIPINPELRPISEAPYM